jgi:hypothetical protein
MTTQPRAAPRLPTAPRIVSPAPRDIWNALVDTDPFTLVSQTPEWTDAATEAGRYVDASRWYVTPEGRDLVLPMVQRLRGPLAIRSSFGVGWGFGGILADGGPTTADVDFVLDDLRRDTALRSTIRINPLLADRWRAAKPADTVLTAPKMAHVLDLDGGVDVVWDERFSSSGRRGVRRAEKLGVEVERVAPSDSLPIFYDMLLQSFERWARRSNEPAWMARYRGTRRDPLRKFEVMSERLEPAFRLYLARHDGKPAAAIVVLSGANAHYTRGVMDADVGGKVNANDLLHWTAIQDAIESGCRSYHMGESRPDSSLARYKEKLGAEAVPYAEYIVERLPLTRANAVLRGAVKRVIGFRDV